MSSFGGRIRIFRSQKLKIVLNGSDLITYLLSSSEQLRG